MEWILFLVGGLVGGAIVGLMLGLALGWSRWGRRRRERAIAVDAELQAARQRAERAVGEAQALRTRLVTAEVLAGRASALEADLASARQEAAWHTDRAAQLEAELAALARGPAASGAEAAWGAEVSIEQAEAGAADGAVPEATRGGGLAAAAVIEAPSRRTERRARPPARAMAIHTSAEPVVAMDVAEAWAADSGPVSEPEREPDPGPVALAAEPEPMGPEPETTGAGPETGVVDRGSEVELQPAAGAAWQPETAWQPEAVVEAEPGVEAVPTSEAGPAPDAEPTSPDAETDFEPMRPGLSDPRQWLGNPSPAGIPYAEDDLQLIHGVGPYLARRLREHGIRTWHQIAEWDDDDMTFASRLIGSFPDRIRREDWVGSARALHEQLYGERLP